MTEPDYARSSATEVMQIVLVVSPILLRKKRSCGVIYSQLIVREECLAKGIPCVKLAVCVAINADLHLQAQVRTRHNKQKQKRANPGPYLYFSQPAQGQAPSAACQHETDVRFNALRQKRGSRGKHMHAQSGNDGMVQILFNPSHVMKFQNCRLLPIRRAPWRFEFHLH